MYHTGFLFQEPLEVSLRPKWLRSSGFCRSWPWAITELSSDCQSKYTGTRLLGYGFCFSTSCTDQSGLSKDVWTISVGSFSNSTELEADAVVSYCGNKAAFSHVFMFGWTLKLKLHLQNNCPTNAKCSYRDGLEAKLFTKQEVNLQIKMLCCARAALGHTRTRLLSRFCISQTTEKMIK